MVRTDFARISRQHRATSVWWTLVTCATRCSSNVPNKMADTNTDGRVTFSRALMKKLILMYKELPCLWDRNSKSFTNKQQRHAALNMLTELVQKYDPNATRVHVLRKLESMRACVRREYKKVQESRLIANSEDEIYTPNLWYYDLFPFIYKYGEVSGYNSTKELSGSPRLIAVSIALYIFICLWLVYFFKTATKELSLINWMIHLTWVNIILTSAGFVNCKFLC